MSKLINTIVLLSVLVILLQSGLRGELSAETIAVFLVIIVFGLAVLGSGKKKKEEMSISRILFGIGLPVTGLLLFAISVSGGRPAEFGAVIGSVLALFLALIGLLIILKGFFR
ncbi:MAG: hypothetical protein QNI99_20525 [Woeseiaceae bacterium]|nr:hypothetical protein [Woeseiaceae bacterium]